MFRRRGFNPKLGKKLEVYARCIRDFQVNQDSNLRQKKDAAKDILR